MIQTEDISIAQGVLFRCDSCGRSERRPYVLSELGGHVAAARIAGYRIGPNNEPVYCPECSGQDEDYWDRQTLAVAYSAGIDAGNPAWGGPS